MNKYYKFINQNKIEQAPRNLLVTKDVDGEERNFINANPSESVYNEQGFCRLESDEYPNDTEYNYIPYYEQDGLIIRQRWERVAINLIETRTNKINEVNEICEQTIVNGIDVVLSDGKQHHFSLTANDQKNLIMLSLTLAENKTSVLPYHGDGELCQYFPAEDIMTIVNKANEFITYQITYCNSLKAYINALEDVNMIKQVSYGDMIPVEYQSNVLKDIYAVQE